MKYRIVITHDKPHDKPHDDYFVIQKRFLFLFWYDVKCIIRLNSMTFDDTVNECHNELINYMQYG